MDITVRVDAPAIPQELTSLWQWLVAEDELRGRIQVVDSVPEPGTLGAITDTLIVAVGTGGAATVAVRALSSALIVWLQHRSGDVSVKVARSDGSTLEYSATNVHAMSLPQIEAAATDLARALGSIDEPE
ncbi:hypothetical protein [Nocardia sp. NPDC004604]|uniref:effector-associated constant component EACC1 n=1 Tax=Nocardia sp. NPDC004604 TaxID=3157013 RepID=UPI0033B87C9A